MSAPNPIRTGKVRDTYEVDDDNLLVVASDRISVYDVVLPQLVPGKGKVLTRLTEFWLIKMLSDVNNHLVTTDMSSLDARLRSIPDLQGRSMLVRKARMLPIECIVRGYLYGSVMNEYKEHGTAAGVELPSGLVKASKLPHPIFTPSTKADIGHDVNITLEQAQELVDQNELVRIKLISSNIYTRAALYALKQGIILADTKFEFGIVDGELTLCDEVLTPDSSRFWELASWQPGEEPVSFDKQYVRNYYANEHPEWDKTDPAPDLPDEIISGTQKKYQEAQDLLVK